MSVFMKLTSIFIILNKKTKKLTWSLTFIRNADIVNCDISKVTVATDSFNYVHIRTSVVQKDMRGFPMVTMGSILGPDWCTKHGGFRVFDVNIKSINMCTIHVIPEVQTLRI